MGWRILKSGYLVVSDADTSKKESGWVTLLYDVYTKWMKLEVLDNRKCTIPQISLVLKSNSVSIEFASHDPKFIVSVKSKIVSNITLSCSSDSRHDQIDVLEWQTMFKSAINPIGTYAVVLVQNNANHHAILLVSKRNVQLSVAEFAGQQARRGSRDLSLNLISTDIEGVKMTVEETIILSLNRQSVVMRTNRMIELYQHLMSYCTGRRNAVGSFKIAHFDYENVRRDSREQRSGLIQEEYSPSGREGPFEENDIYVLPSHNIISSHVPIRPPPKMPAYDRTKSPPLPPIAPHRLAKLAAPKPDAVHFPKPAPPPKPKNAKQILSEFEEKTPSPVIGEPIYKTVYKRNISTTSTGSLYADMENLNDQFWEAKVTLEEDEPPEVPPTPPQYIDHAMLSTPGVHWNNNRKSDYENVTLRTASADPGRFLTESGFAPAKPIRASLIIPVIDEEEIDSEMYDSLYAIGVYSPEPVGSLSVTKPTINSSPIPYPKGGRKSIAVMQNISHTSLIQPSASQHSGPGDVIRKTEKFLSRMHILEKKLAKHKKPISMAADIDENYYTEYNYSDSESEVPPKKIKKSPRPFRS